MPALRSTSGLKASLAAGFCTTTKPLSGTEGGYSTPPLTSSDSLHQSNLLHPTSTGYQGAGTVHHPLSSTYRVSSMPPESAPAPLSSVRPSSEAWTPRDDQTLMQARAQGMNWAHIQQGYFPFKTPKACRKRHERLMERRNADDWDGLRLDNLAKNYMTMRRDIWSGLAAQTGEKWNVVEQKCMSQGLKNLQIAARSASRRERMLETGIRTTLASSSVSHPGSVPTYNAYEHHDDSRGSGYAENLEAEWDADNASDQSSNEKGYDQVHYRPRSASIAGKFNEQGLVESMDTGISEIIRRQGSTRTLEMPISKETKSALSADSPEEVFSRGPPNLSTLGPLLVDIPEEKELNKQGLNNSANINLQKTLSGLESITGQPRESNTCSAVGSEKKLVLKTSLLPADPPKATISDQGDEDDNIGAYEPTPAPIHKLDSSASSIPDVEAQTSRQEISENSLQDEDLVDGSIGHGSWEDQSESNYDKASATETRTEPSVLLSLAGAIRHRLLSQLMLAFHLMYSEDPAARTVSSYTDSPSENNSTRDTLPSNSSPGSASSTFNKGGTVNQSNTGNTNGKRGSEDGEDNRRNKKRLHRDPPDFNSTPADRRKFPCPYHKRDSKCFGASIGDVCARSWDIAKLKEHLYRKHYVKFQCQRCKVQVSSRFELDDHAESATPCQPRARQLIDGFTFEMYERLHNKKKQFLGQSDEDRWREIYELLFPSVESVPNPLDDRDTLHLKEPSSERDTTLVDECINLAILNEFTRRAAAVVANAIKPLEIKLLDQVSNLIHDSREAVSTKSQQAQSSSFHDYASGQKQTNASFAATGCGDLFSAIPAVQTSTDVDMNYFIDLQPEGLNQLNIDSLLGFPALPDGIRQSTTNRSFLHSGFTGNSLCFCEDTCTCQLAVDHHSSTPSWLDQSIDAPASTKDTDIMKMMKRIQVLEKKLDIDSDQ